MLRHWDDFITEFHTNHDRSGMTNDNTVTSWRCPFFKISFENFSPRWQKKD